MKPRVVVKRWPRAEIVKFLIIVAGQAELLAERLIDLDGRRGLLLHRAGLPRRLLHSRCASLRFAMVVGPPWTLDCAGGERLLGLLDVAVLGRDDLLDGDHRPDATPSSRQNSDICPRLTERHGSCPPKNPVLAGLEQFRIVAVLPRQRTCLLAADACADLDLALKL